MRRVSLLFRILAVLLVAAFAGAAHAWIRSPAIAFAELPPGTAYPEGIAVDAQGNLYVSTFDIGKKSGPGTIVVFSRAGRVQRTIAVTGSSPLLLGVAFQPQLPKSLLVCDLGTGKIFKVDISNDTTTTFATLPDIVPDPNVGPGPNALAFDADGNVYISDSFQAAIWRTGPTGGAPSVPWLADPKLGTAGVPPFGANGLAFDKAFTTLYVANTGNDTIVRVPVVGGVAGAADVFINSINGADGLAMDADDNLWVAANQSDEIVVVDTKSKTPGRVIAKLGDFDGIDPHGAAKGLLFPASLAFADGFVYVTNLALDLRNFKLPQTTNSQWSADVTRYTVSRIRAQIPPIQGP